MTLPRQRFFQLQAHTHATRLSSIASTREALDGAGASVTDIRHLSNKASVFQLLLPAAEWQPMVDALSRSGLGLEAPDRAWPEALVADDDGDVFGTLQLIYAGNEPESRDEIPHVPG